MRTTTEFIILRGDFETEVILSIEDILFIERSDQNNILIHHTKGSTKCRNSLKGFINSVDCSNLFRSHKSYIINLNQVESVSKYFTGYVAKFNFSDKMAFISSNKISDFRNQYVKL